LILYDNNLSAATADEWGIKYFSFIPFTLASETDPLDFKNRTQRYYSSELEDMTWGTIAEGQILHYQGDSQQIYLDPNGSTHQSMATHRS
jgi:hypothetical protein